jgi:hypothetical protein
MLHYTQNMLWPECLHFPPCAVLFCLHSPLPQLQAGSVTSFSDQLITHVTLESAKEISSQWVTVGVPATTEVLSPWRFLMGLVQVVT